MLRYFREGVAPPSLSTAYEKLRDERVRNLVDQMLQRDPSSRLSAKQHIEDNTGPEKLFPDYFGTFMFPFFRRVLSSSLASPDARVWYVCEHYSEIFQSVLGARDAKGARFFEERKRIFDGSNERVAEHLLQDEVDTFDESPVSDLLDMARSFVQELESHGVGGRFMERAKKSVKTLRERLHVEPETRTRHPRRAVEEDILKLGDFKCARKPI